MYVGFAALTLLMDFGLTFVTPALAFTTRSAKEALSAGIRMLRSAWPKDLWYALVPPMAILIMANVVPNIIWARRLSHDWSLVASGHRPPSVPESIRLVTAAFAAVGAIVGLVFKGATTAFYARRVDVPPFGASSTGKAATVPPRPDAGSG